MSIVSINPATEERLAEYELLSEGALEERLDRAWRAFEAWRYEAPESRRAPMLRAAELLEQRKRGLGALMTREMGKPVSAAVAEVEKCAWVCRFYAEDAPRFLARECIASDAAESYLLHQPLGPVLAVMPWNFPFWQVFRFAAPALMAGNVGLLKHASNVPGCALAIEQIFTDAGFPPGAFQALLVEVGQVESLLADSRVRAATLTGSEAAGASVASAAGGQIKKTVLELGGSDPFIVLPSADIDMAVETGVRARTLNNGQSCIAAKRFIVHEQIADRFEEQFVRRMRALRIGDPMAEATDVGPLATARGREDVHRQVQESVAAGATVLCGGEPGDGRGFFYPPTVLRDIAEGSPAYDQEIFGPVASIFRVSDVDGAIQLANATEFGLGSSAWTTEAAEQERLIARLDAGAVFINSMVASDPRLPFGGIKRSGYGRELGRLGILEFTNAKTVSVGRRERAGTFQSSLD